MRPGLAADDRRVKTAATRLTEYHARAVAAVGRPADLIGFHGQTILHQPTARPDRARTWQIGDAAWLAWRTGIRVAWDFRTADVAAGGEGAPLAPVFHAALAGALPRPVAVLNIGGVANVTWIGADGALLAFDTGPGNGPLDDWVARHTGAAFDADGALARSGAVDHAVLGRLLADPYFARPAPKSLDRLDFADDAGGQRDRGAVAGGRCRDAGRVHRRRGCRGRAAGAAACAGWSAAAAGTIRRSWRRCARC